MTEKELKRLSKLEIIDILIAQDEEIEELQKKIENLEDQLARSNEVIDKVISGAGTAGLRYAVPEKTKEPAQSEPLTGVAFYDSKKKETDSAVIQAEKDLLNIPEQKADPEARTASAAENKKEKKSLFGRLLPSGKKGGRSDGSK